MLRYYGKQNILDGFQLLFHVTFDIQYIYWQAGLNRSATSFSMNINTINRSVLALVGIYGHKAIS